MEVKLFCLVPMMLRYRPSGEGPWAEMWPSVRKILRPVSGLIW